MKTWFVGCVLVSVILAGCTSPSMKETPFYTQEYEQYGKPDPHRINVVLVYRRDPVLHVLWPLMEFGPKYVAIRPVYSAYNRDTDHSVYNVLWPIARFDPAKQDYRIFPVYWGDEYFNMVPLYWHEGDPFSGVGHNALFPLWIWRNREDGSSLDVFWPLYAKRNYPGHQAWRLWPLYGTQLKNERHYRYVAWPFIHTYSNAVHSGHGAIPLYWHDKSDDRSTTVSLPYSRSMTDKAGARSWDLTLPLCYRQWKGDRFYWEFYPFLSWGERDSEKSDLFYALGLGRRLKSEDRSSHYVIPVYYYDRDPGSRSFYTLPWWSKKYVDGTGWHALAPVYYRSRYEDSSSFYSLPWWSKKYTDGSGWHASIPLYYRGYAEGASSFYSLPWWYKKNSDDSGWHTSIPFYLRTRSDDRKAFYSLPWSGVKNADGSGWQASIPFYYWNCSETNESAFYSPVWLKEKHRDGSAWEASFPLYFSSRSDDGSVLVTPVYARKLQPDGSREWRCFIPFVYFNETYDSHFMTMLGGRWRMGGHYNWLALPVLSGGASDADSGRNIWFAGLAGQQWDEEGRSHYVAPLYYKAPELCVSLPYTSWRVGDRKTRAIPVFLSGWYKEDDTSGGLIAGGLVGYRKGGERPFHYAVPFYYAAPELCVSLPYISWRAGDRKTRVIPVFLSGWYSENDVSGAILAAGLAGYRSGDEKAYHYFLPFYYRAPQKGTFLSLPYAEWRSGDRKTRVIPVFLSGWSTDEDASEALLFGGLAHWKTRGQQFEASHVLPFYLWSRDDYLYTAIFGQNRKLSYYATPLVGQFDSESGNSGSWVIPLYYHKRYPSGDLRGYYFPLGYYRKEQDRTAHGFVGVYNRTHRKYYEQGDAGRRLVQEKRLSNYLMTLVGDKYEAWHYASDETGEPGRLESYRKLQSWLGPTWVSLVDDQIAKGKRIEESALLMLLYDVRHEQQTGEKVSDYLRRRVLWRLYHYEKLNGDVTVDIFPGITIDSYKNGYHKSSFLWRVFRYEKDPESGRTKLDLLFIPLKR